MAQALDLVPWPPDASPIYAAPAVLIPLEPKKTMLAGVKERLYHPCLPTLRRMDMDTMAHRLTDTHSRTTTTCSKEDFQRATFTLAGVPSRLLPSRVSLCPADWGPGATREGGEAGPGRRSDATGEALSGNAAPPPGFWFNRSSWSRLGMASGLPSAERASCSPRGFPRSADRPRPPPAGGRSRGRRSEGPARREVDGGRAGAGLSLPAAPKRPRERCCSRLPPPSLARPFWSCASRGPAGTARGSWPRCRPVPTRRSGPATRAPWRTGPASSPPPASSRCPASTAKVGLAGSGCTSAGDAEMHARRCCGESAAGWRAATLEGGSLSQGGPFWLLA
ncbi:testis, prostate and placenta-expressed protein isoform X1 [Crotalus tigris]|uniref:testis, prostate and placenta-expressed protein isoform X1 n=1 Tax=Crotalus tigris TaxID=88082 RepID=UPI00192F1FDF|nr:testis, prostate and placenta-expressed protein isoform X1 [Crotalus tigris]